jgi:hypothetical protein
MIFTRIDETVGKTRQLVWQERPNWASALRAFI